MALHKELKPTLESIVLRIRSEQETEAAYEYLINETTPYLQRVVANTLGEATAVEIEEIISITWINIIESLERFDPSKSSFRTWASTIANNKSKDYLRKRSRRQGDTSLDAPSVKYRLSDATVESPEEYVNVKETELDLLSTLLKYKNQTDVLLYLLKVNFDLKSSELFQIASEADIDLSEKAIQHRIYRLRDYLKSQLGNSGRP